jgi:Icc-related predicted phosphoesterase
MKIACISDTHCQLEKVEVPPCDIIVHTGDLTYKGEIPEITTELDKLKEKKEQSGARAVFLTPGNHDWGFQYHPQMFKDICSSKGITLLNHELVEFEGLKIFGSPYQPFFCDWAFNVDRGEPLARLWAQIPNDVQILLTHGPAHMILDKIPDKYVKPGSINKTVNVGCEALKRRLEHLRELKLHVCGHIHDSYGQVQVYGVKHINASICTEKYKPTNKAILVDI